MIRLLDVILVLVLLEGVALVAFNRRTGRGLAMRDLVPNLAAGFFLMLALRFALAGDAGFGIAGCLLVALVAHGLDLLARWSGRR